MPHNIDQFVGAFVVVETTDSAYLGTLTVLDQDHIVLRTGFVGRPPILAVKDVEAITPAEEHPDVAA